MSNTFDDCSYVYTTQDRYHFSNIYWMYANLLHIEPHIPRDVNHVGNSLNTSRIKQIKKLFSDIKEKLLPLDT